MPIRRRPIPALVTLALLGATLGCHLGPRAPTLTPPPPTVAPPTRAPGATPQPDAPVEVPPAATEQPLRSVSALPNPARFQWSEVAGGFHEPVDLQHAGDRRLFVVEQRGMIWIVEDGRIRQDPYLDLRDRVNDRASEQGLLGLAFHPQYARNGTLFVNYTAAGGDTIIARFNVSLGQARVDPDTEQMILRIDQPFSNHNGGGMAFGPDGYLYIATGDGGSAADPFGNGQRLDTPLGKILRLDVNEAAPYAIPPDNPFARGDGLAEIWAFGLRNPWRFAFDPLTGDLYIGDVGQNSWEEIDFLPAGSIGGANFGWSIREGAHPFGGRSSEGLIDPVAEYRNTGRACSVTGGVIVRSPALPEWQGVYLFGDYCSGEIWGLVRDPGGNWQSEVIFSTGLNISSFGSDVEGNAYLVHHGGAIYRLERAP